MVSYKYYGCEARLNSNAGDWKEALMRHHMNE